MLGANSATYGPPMQNLAAMLGQSSATYTPQHAMLGASPATYGPPLQNLDFLKDLGNGLN